MHGPGAAAPGEPGRALSRALCTQGRRTERDRESPVPTVPLRWPRGSWERPLRGRVRIMCRTRRLCRSEARSARSGAGAAARGSPPASQICEGSGLWRALPRAPRAWPPNRPLLQSAPDASAQAPGQRRRGAPAQQPRAHLTAMGAGRFLGRPAHRAAARRVSGALRGGTCTQAAISVAQNSRPGRRHKGPRPRNGLLTKNRARGNVVPTCSASRAPACVARAVPALRGGAAPLLLRAPPPPCARAACRRRARQQVPRRSSGSSSGTTGACRGGALVCAGRGWRCRGCYRDHLGERMISPGVRRFCSSAGSQVPTIFLCCTRVCSAPRFAAPSALPLAAPCRGCHLEHLV